MLQKSIAFNDVLANDDIREFKHAEVSELAWALKHRNMQEANWNFPAKEMRLMENGNLLTPEGEIKLAEPAFKHVVGLWAKVGMNFANHFEKLGRRDVVCYAVNESLKECKSQVKLITRDGDHETAIVSIPSSSYNYLDDRAVLVHAIENTPNNCRGGNLCLERAQISDTCFRMAFTNPIEGLIEPKRNDIIRNGFELVNSPTFDHKLEVAAFSHRLWCDNGCYHTIKDFSFGWYHRGNFKLGEEVTRRIETVQQNLALVAPNIAKMIEVDVTEKQTDKIEVKLQEVIGKREFKKLVAEEDSPWKKQSNWYDMWNQSTALAHQYEKPEEKKATETFGGWVFEEFLSTLN